MLSLKLELARGVVVAFGAPGYCFVCRASKKQSTAVGVLPGCQHPQGPLIAAHLFKGGAAVYVYMYHNTQSF